MKIFLLICISLMSSASAFSQWEITEWRSESNNIKSGLNAFDVDITPFKNGVYLYNITIDDFMIHTDKFMISR